MTDPVAELGALIRTRRELQHWTQSELARLAQCKHGSIKSYETGASVPPTKTMRLLIGALGLCLDEIEPLYEAALAERRRKVREPSNHDWDGALCEICRILVPGRASCSEAIRGTMFCAQCADALAEPFVDDGELHLPACCQEPCTTERQIRFDAWLETKIIKRGDAPKVERAEQWWLLDEVVGEGRALA